MKLDDVFQGYQALLFMERYVDEGAKTYSPFAGRSEVPPEYQPRSDNPFELITIYAPQSGVSVFQADPTARLWSSMYVPRECFSWFTQRLGRVLASTLGRTPRPPKG